ncbi:hypothetical protein ES708_22461 [subsurface metagenome]
MPAKEKKYKWVIFTPEVIKQAHDSLVSTLPGKSREPTLKILRIQLSAIEQWAHDTEEEFFADYRRGFEQATFKKEYTYANRIELWVSGDNTRVTVSLPNRADVEKVFNIFEANVEKCRLPKQPDEESNGETDWINKSIDKIEGRCPIAGRKLKLALIKLESEDAEEWQNATMLIRDAWIELTQWLCKVNNIDTSDIQSDAVVDRLKKLKIDKADERLFNLARASFGLYGKHHKRDIDNDTAAACVISTIVSMQTVIREVFSAKS